MRRTSASSCTTSPVAVCPLEDQLQSKLELPRRCGCCRAADFSYSDIGDRDPIRIVGVDGRVWIREGRGIEQVERLCPKLKLGFLVNREGLEQREAQSLRARPLNLVALFVSDRKSTRLNS